jgi:signal peptidase
MARGFLPLPAARALNVVLALLVIAAVVPFVVYAFPPVVGADDSYVVLSGSMEPAISPGDTVVVESIPAEAIAIGDVITFRTAGSEIPVTHRVVDVTEGSEGQRAFVTRGDANEDPDQQPVTADRVIGRVAFTVPYVGYVIQFVNSPTGFVALVLVPIGLLLLNEIWSFVAGSRDERDTEPSHVATSEPGGDDAAGFTLTQTDISLSIAVLGLLAVYAVYVGLVSRDALSIAVAVGATTAVALAVAVRQFGFGDDPVSASTATDGGEASDAPLATGRSSRDAVGGGSLARVVPSATLPPEIRERPWIEVGSRAALSDLADRIGRPVVRDAETNAQLLVDGDVVYAFVAAPRSDGAESSGGAARRDGDDGPAKEDPR